MTNQKERNNIGQTIVASNLESVLDVRRQVKKLEVLIYDKLGPSAVFVIGDASMFEVTTLAIDALAGSDPAYLIDVYNHGGVIEKSVVMDLATAVIKAKRHESDSLEEFNKLQNKNK